MAAQTIPPLRIAVVGGGIAGLTAALSLVKSHRDGANIKIDVYETASKFAEIGAGVAFGPNAQRALRMLDCEEVLTKNAAGADSDPDTWFYMTTGQKDHPRCGEVVRAIQGHNAAKGSVHRADFLDGLIARLPKELAHFNHRCVGYEPHSEGITLTFTSQDGKTITAEADVVIASDGIKSLIRKHLYTRKNLDVSSQTAVYAEWIAWRGMIPVEKFKQVFGNKMDTKMMFFGLDKHILTFPVRQGKFVNIVGFVRDPEHKKLGDHTGPWSEPRPAEEMLEDYSTFSDECVNMLREIENPSIWGIFELKELSCSTDERLVLIGDSAHAMTPHQGSGAGQAIEDALFITSLLTSPKVANAPISSRPSQIQKAINIYASVRHARGAQVAKTSREAGLLYEFRSVTGEGDDMEKITQNIQHRMQWIWNWDTEGELKKALESLD